MAPVALPTSVQRVAVTLDQEGQRLDNFLMTRLKGAPRSLVYRIIRKGEVRINGSRCRPDSRLAEGDEVRIPPVTLAAESVAPPPGARVQERIEAAIVFENDDLILVNKPSGLAVHGGSGLSFGLIEALRAARPDARFLELVHRLDRDTSGLIMVAKRRTALLHLQEQIKAKTIEKIYHALVVGAWPAHRREVNAPLRKNELRSGERVVRVDAEGKTALTTFRVVSRFDGYTLVEARPVTGRTHQIRVHAAFAGHAIAGDDKYLDDEAFKAFRQLGGSRLMLHARTLELCLPGSRQKIRFDADYDEGFAKALSLLASRKSESRG